MGADEKLLAKICGNKIPNDITMNELNRLLVNLGFVQQSKNGAHYNYRHPELNYILTIDSHDFRQEVKTIYIKNVRIALSELGIKGETK